MAPGDPSVCELLVDLPGRGFVGEAVPGPLDYLHHAALYGRQQDYVLQGLEADGAIGPRTREALRWENEHLLCTDVSSAESVKTFQRSHGIAADGVVGPATQAAMRAVRSARRAGDDPKDRYGRAMDHGAGFGSGLDPADPASVRDFQRSHGLWADGIIGARTQAALRALRAERNGPARTGHPAQNGGEGE